MKRFSPLFLLCFLVACGSTAVPMAPHKSPHFDPVSAQLQLGGTVYAYVDIDGDAERAADFLISLLRDMPALMKPEYVQYLSSSGLVRILGLHNVRAIGLSSYKDEPLYHNRGFIYHTGRREGLMKLLGDEPKELDVISIAPSDADLVWEQQLNLKVLLEIVEDLSQRGVGATPDELNEALGRRVLDLDMTLRDIIERLDTTAGLVLSVDRDRPLRIPGESFWFPYTDFLFRVDGLGDLVESIARKAAGEPFFKAERNEEWLVIRPAIALPPPWNAYEPAVIKEIATDRMYIASRPDFLTRCLAGQSQITKTADYTRAFEGLPKDGNGMIYLSPRLTREMHALLDRIINSNGSTVFTTITRLFLADAGLPIGWVSRSTDDGILFTSNSSSSHKSTLLTLGYATLLPAVAVVGASMLAPKADSPAPPL